MSNDNLIGEWKWIIYVTMAYLFHDLIFLLVVEAFITLICKAKYKYMKSILLDIVGTDTSTFLYEQFFFSL